MTSIWKEANRVRAHLRETPPECPSCAGRNIETITTPVVDAVGLSYRCRECGDGFDDLLRVMLTGVTIR